MEGKFYAVSEAAKMMGISARAVYGHISSERVKAVRINGHLSVHEDEILKFKPHNPGRARQYPLLWHQPVNNALVINRVRGRLVEGREPELRYLVKRLDKQSVYAGLARGLVTMSADKQVEIIFFWRHKTMPEESVRDLELRKFQEFLGSIVVWEEDLFKGEELLHTAP